MIKIVTKELEFDNFINEIQEYDAIVNQTLLPMIKTKLDNPKDKLVKELNVQKQKAERIRKPYFIKNKIAMITKKDNDEILKIIKKYYTFEEIKTTNKNKIEFTKRQTATHNKSKENREKVLT